jgi:NAD(P)-dependent dehydrogenase (short-subunit alcohol dehydrogenase family)
MAHGGIPDTAIYTISKAALDSVTKVAANQLKDAQIRCVCARSRACVCVCVRARACVCVPVVNESLVNPCV